MDKTIKPIECLRGEVTMPGDKSISHRAVFIGGIARGRTEARNFLEAEDCLRTVSAFRAMGIDIKIRNKKIAVHGRGLRGLRKPEGKLYLGNSGTTMRILPGVLAGQDFSVVLTGDESLSKRPMRRIMEPLRKMGMNISSDNADGFPPLAIRGGRVKPVKYSTEVASAQVKSCILFAGLYTGGVTSVTEPFMSRDHTERMLKFYGASVTREGLTVSLAGGGELRGQNFFIPGDISSAAFFIAGACILKGSRLTVRDVGLNPTRLGFLNALSRMGADIAVGRKKGALEPYGDITVKSAPLKSTVVEREELPLLIDEVPILAVLASRAEGETVIKGTSELRVKETDRIFSMTENLGRMGVELRAEGDNLVVRGKKGRLKSARLDSFKDHRTAMAMTIASLASDGECALTGTGCINTSFPEFFELLASVAQ